MFGGNCLTKDKNEGQIKSISKHNSEMNAIVLVFEDV